ncbi:MAG: hypothetical protein JST82_11795 [Bacteroidetes bacterium]|nr:hypothetical protein [Bacteroidota bacterium]
MLRTILLIVAGILSVALYRMLSRGGKTYAYDRTQMLSFLTDGSENVVQEETNGSIIITNKTVLIDGLEYIFKPSENEPIQALLDFDDNGLRSVRVLLPEGEKQYFINRNPASMRVA